MDNRAHPVDVLLEQIRQEEGEAFVFDEGKIREDISKSVSSSASLPIRLLTIFGGIMASIFFIGFLLLIGLYDSDLGMLIVGLVFLIGSVAILRYNANTMMETSCVAFNMMGYLLFCTGFSELISSDIALCVALAALAAGVFLVADNMLLRFLAVLVFFGSLAGITLIYEADNLMHVFIGVVTALLTYMSLKEAKFMRRSALLNQVYRPLRMGLVFSLLSGLALLVHQPLLSIDITHLWVSSLFLVVALLVVLAKVLQQAPVTNRKTQAIVYICCCLVLAPTMLTPSIAGALLVMVSSFYIGHRVSFTVGLLGLIYFVILYYYDLQFTLLVKSGILVLSGILFIVGYLLLHKNLKSYVE
ncbi:DUF4401 domain-containing protein [Pontibacter toksunensis]|uniref:DUF4401 domain-containing protein n=1 Tax=Pontibacter toksunensis TaxID=1332631 RepID=A0ABW6BZC9_9BACT